MRFSRKEKLLLGVMFLALVVTAAILVRFVYQEVVPRADGPRNLSEYATAAEAYPQAETLARQWRIDAQLSRVTAAWRSPTEEELLSGKTSWAFYFYSPSAGQSYIVSAAGAEVHESRINDEPQAPPLIPLAQWVVDSPQAIRDFLDHGGRQFLQVNAHSNVHLQLLASEDQRVEWNITALSAPGQPTVLFFLNATTGMVQ